jgi:bacterioferritin-associated ferredoxin
VTTDEVADLVDSGVRTEEGIGTACGAGTSCGGCLDRLQAMISLAGPVSRFERLGATA